MAVSAMPANGEETLKTGVSAACQACSRRQTIKCRHHRIVVKQMKRVP
jgi:hypothetical protein